MRLRILLGIIGAMCAVAEARAPRPRTACPKDMVVLGGLACGPVVETIWAQRKRLEGCAETTGPAAASRLWIRFLVTKTGGVEKTAVLKEKSTLRNEALEQCVLDVIEGLRFPRPRGAKVTEVDYPMEFPLPK